jgi:hypothetical protein
MKTLCGGLNDLIAATSMLKRTTKWSLIPDVVETLDTLLGNADNNKSKVLLEAGP